MPIKYYLLLFVHVLGTSLFAQHYTYTFDLTTPQDDKILVELVPPKISVKEILFNMPKVVPGTYTLNNYGRVLEKVAAFNKKGKQLKVEQINENQWRIYKANTLTKLSYLVSDTWDDATFKNIFKPAGSNFEAEHNMVVNNFCMLGYLEGLDTLPFYVNIHKYANFYGATALKRQPTLTDETDYFVANNYFQLHDSPILYAVPDTVHLQVANTDVLIAVYSDSKTRKAHQIAQIVAPILNAQRRFLVDSLPIRNYTFLFYLSNQFRMSDFGALEHNYSSLYTLPDMDINYLKPIIGDVVAHEFLHIITPLNIHPQEIAQFNFVEPEMSRHLWLYEGVTEYHAHLSQVREGLVSLPNFFDKITQKINASATYNDYVPFTELSTNILEKYADQYPNVYEKGALIAMCLDLKLIEQTNGNQNLRKLLSELSVKFGANKPFRDSYLFDDIGDLTTPEIKDFLYKYIGNANDLPLKDLLEQVGVLYQPTQIVREVSYCGFGPQSLKYAEPHFIVVDTSLLDEQGKSLGFHNSDTLLTWNGVTLTTNNINLVMDEFVKNTKVGDRVTLEIQRGGQTQTLNPTIIGVPSILKNKLALVPQPTEQQIKLRKAWLNH
jgi:predicted metalloprotease with PDZ domain